MRILLAVVCAILVQTCSSQIHVNYGVRDRISLSPQFLNDIKLIADHFHDNIFVTETINRLMGKLMDATQSPNRRLDTEMIQMIADETNGIEQDENTNALKYFLSKKLPPENIMGILNLMQAVRPKATSGQRHNVIEYLYGRDTFKFPTNLSVNVHPNCVLRRRMNLTALNFIVGIERQVIKDVVNITNTFSCNPHVMAYMERTVQQLTVDLNGINAIIDSCSMIKYSYLLEDLNIQDYYSRAINKTELVLSTRLPESRYKNLLGFSRSCLPGAEDDTIRDASIYLYGYVRLPQATCQRRRH